MKDAELLKDLKEQLQAHLLSQGWETNVAVSVVDSFVESFESDFIPDDFATYDEMAANMGVGVPSKLDESAIRIIDQIKACVRE